MSLSAGRRPSPEPKNNTKKVAYQWRSALLLTAQALRAESEPGEQTGAAHTAGEVVKQMRPPAQMYVESRFYRLNQKAATWSLILLFYCKRIFRSV